MSNEDDKLDIIKALYLYRKQKEALQQDLIDLQAKIEKQENKAIKSFKEGLHTIDRYVVKITTSTTKGRATPAWKKISEAIQERIETVRERCINKWKLDTETADKFRNEVINKIPEIQKENTNTGESKTTTEIEVNKVKSQN